MRAQRARRKYIWVGRNGTFGNARFAGRPAVRVSLAAGAAPKLHVLALKAPLPRPLAGALERDSRGVMFRRFIDAQGKTVAQLGAARLGGRRSTTVVLHSLSIDQQAREKGLGNALGRIVSNEAIRKWDPKRLVAFVDPANKGVVRVCMNNGMRALGDTTSEKQLASRLKTLAWQNIYNGVFPPQLFAKRMVMVREVK